MRSFVLSIALSALASTTLAEPFTVTNTYDDTFGAPPIYTDVMVGGADSQRAVYAGLIHVTAGDFGDRIAFCIELAQDIDLPARYDVMDAPLSAQDRDALSRLFTGYYGEIDTNNEAAAFQMAIWEIIGDDSFDLKRGAVQQSGNLPVRALAERYLNGLSAFDAAYDLTFLGSKASQDIIFGVPQMVSAPGS